MTPPPSAAPVTPLRGIHHLKFPVSDLDRSLAFYEQAFGARRLPHLDHRTPDGRLYAYILEIDGLGTAVELRLNPDQAEKQRLFDSITVAVDGRAALERWDEHLTALGVPHSPVIVSLQAWLIVVEDPDRHRIRLYTLESHGSELAPDYGSSWLAD